LPRPSVIRSAPSSSFRDTLEDIPNLVGAVTRRGYANDVVNEILGGNMMRVVDAALRA
jgi:microsomal dipeptidase-like Zn-dependent dipeptidase